MSYFTEDSTVGQAALSPRPIGSAVGNIARSASSGVFSSSSATPTLIPNQTVTLQASGNGRPFRFGLVSDGLGNTSYMGQGTSTVSVFRDGNLIASESLNPGGVGLIPVTLISGLDFPSAGNSHVYEVLVTVIAGTFLVQYCRLVVWEI